MAMATKSTAKAATVRYEGSCSAFATATKFADPPMYVAANAAHRVGSAGMDGNATRCKATGASRAPARVPSAPMTNGSNKGRGGRNEVVDEDGGNGDIRRRATAYGARPIKVSYSVDWEGRRPRLDSVRESMKAVGVFCRAGGRRGDAAVMAIRGIVTEGGIKVA